MTLADMMEILGILLTAGLVAGLLAGMLGVGGGIVLVPAFLLILDATGYQGADAMQIAIATSLATIIVTSLRSLHAHWKRGAVDMDLLKRLALPVCLAAVGGMVLAQVARSSHLMAVFGVLGSAVGAWMLLGPGVARQDARLPRPPVLSAYAALFGGLSALIGIGGGSFFVPFLTWNGRSSHQAVATSAGIGVLIAAPAVLGFLVVPTPDDAPPFTVGQVSIVAAVIVVCATMLTAPLGARLAHLINAALLKRIFGGFLVLTAGKMLVSAILSF